MFVARRDGSGTHSLSVRGVQTGQSIPLDLRIRRMRLPGQRGKIVSLKSSSHARTVAVLLVDGVEHDIPVTTLTWAIPWESRRMTPIWEGVAPFLASLQIWSTTWSGVVLSHDGALRL